jgi:CheY-like chemotaxis protein
MDKVINILMIEDDSLDVRDAQRTLDKMNVLYKMQVARNGEEALDYLKGGTANPAYNRPDIILLDLNMPKMNGVEFLNVIRSNDQWKDLKVFVITTSDEKEDRQRVKGLGVSGYIVKPLKFNNPSSIDSFNLMIDIMNIKNRI